MKRILILGAPGSGKSFLTRELAQKLSLPAYHLDYFFYKPNWQEVGQEKFAQKQREIIIKEHWIIDGNSVRMLHERLKRADAVIFLDVPLMRRLIRIVKRDIFTKNIHMPTGCSFSWKQFFSFLKNHVLFWNKKDTILSIIALYPHISFFHLCSPDELKKFLQKVK